MPPRLVRRQPLPERISAWLNPLDLLLHISTWFSSFDWDGVQYSLATPMGIFLNLVCFIARASSDNNGRRRGAGDVLRRGAGGTSLDGWGAAISYSLYVLSWGLALGSLFNTIYCFSRKRAYRLFENNINIAPQTPSARRVRVDSSPSNSPLRFIGNFIEPFLDKPESREHPIETRDVWEVSIWDPTPLSLRLFALFSPAHVAVYFLSFPIASSPTYNSVLTGHPVSPTTNPYSAILTVLVTQVLLTAQLLYIQNFFTQQGLDRALISRELMHEYDTKYVHPRLNVIRRDVSVQTMDTQTGEPASVELYTPCFSRQGFKTAPNPNYAELTMHSQFSPLKRTPASPSSFGSPLSTRGPVRQPQFGPGNLRRSVSSGTSMYGGSSRDGSFEEATTTSRRKDTGYASGSVGVHRSSSNLGAQSSFDEPTGRARDGGYASGSAAAPHRSSSNIGMHGLVNMSAENSRSLSPSKMPNPLKKGFSARGSSYTASLTPSRR